MACLGNIERHLPGLEASEYQITSDATDEYNCVAWAVGEDDRWWSHEVDDEYFWPDRALRSEGVESYQAMFALYGFAECDNGDLERGVEKIALFADEGRFTHVARNSTQADGPASSAKTATLSTNLKPCGVGRILGRGIARTATARSSGSCSGRYARMPRKTADSAAGE